MTCWRALARSAAHSAGSCQAGGGSASPGSVRRGRTAGRGPGPRARGGRAGCRARPAAVSVRCAPWRIRSLAPRERGSSGDPGTANSSRPASWARRAVIRLPERSAASTTTTPSDEAGDDAVAAREVARLGRGAERRLGDHGACLGDAALQIGVLRRVGIVEAAGHRRDGAPGLQRAGMRRARRCRAQGRRPPPARAPVRRPGFRPCAGRWPRRCGRRPGRPRGAPAARYRPGRR